MGETSNSPQVSVKYHASGFNAEFVVAWKHSDGHDRFRAEICALLDGLHQTWNKHEGDPEATIVIRDEELLPPPYQASSEQEANDD